ncbi:MAG: hypothetical protein MUO31_13145 [Thermodesulfovibrionales bacterium]|nr:hypothetical protein [Thermodesulfovibrionales bacterium]
MTKIEWTEQAKTEFEELQTQMMEAYEKWDSEEGATALGWHERINNILKQYPKETK